MMKRNIFIDLPKDNFIDKTIKVISPEWYLRRYRAKMSTALAGAYIGARTDRRQTTMWKTSSGDPDADILSDLPALRERSRDLIRNSPLATGAINTVASNVVGTGLKLQSRINRRILNISDEQAEEWESTTEEEFALWAESKECDIARTLKFNDIQKLVFRQTLENGDVFCLTPRIDRSGSPYSLKLHVVEADRISNENDQRDTLTLSGGIEKDENGAPKTYHIRDVHPGNILGITNKTWQKIPAFGNATGLRNILHLYDVLRPSQTRGVPYLAPVIEHLKQLDKYMEAELMATVVSAMLTVFIKTEMETDLAPMTPLTETTGTTSDKDFKLASGAILSLAPGESVDTVNPNRPNTGFDAFVMAILRQIGTALEIPFEILIKHFTASYSASRAALLEAWRFFRGRRKWLASNFCQEIYEIWLYEAIASGRISAPGYFSDPLIKRAYAGSVWIGDAPGQIDPEKEVNAAEKRLSLGLSTVDEETVLISGGDFESNYPRVVKEIGMFKKAGMQHPAVAEKVEAVEAMPAIDKGGDKEDETLTSD